jgi:hypothetical protein
MTEKQCNASDGDRSLSSSLSASNDCENRVEGMQRTGTYATGVGTYDVLLGRGTGPSMNKGNIDFREAVEKLKRSYIATSSRKVKKQIVRKIVKDIKAKKGRFLNKLTKNEIKMLGLSPKDIYEVVPDEVALEKAKQAIRYVHYKKDASTRKKSPSLSSMKAPGKVLKGENCASTAYPKPKRVSENPRQSYSPKSTPTMVSSPGLTSSVPPFILSSASRLQPVLASTHQQLFQAAPLAAYNPSIGTFLGTGLPLSALSSSVGLHNPSLQRLSRGLPMASYLSLSQIDPVFAEASLRLSRGPVLTEANLRLSRAVATMVAQREQPDSSSS